MIITHNDRELTIDYDSSPPEADTNYPGDVTINHVWLHHAGKTRDIIRWVKVREIEDKIIKEAMAHYR